MAKQKKPRVVMTCVANRYAGPRERIVEFSHPNGGGLISFFACEDGNLLVQVYRQDDTVEVMVSGHNVVKFKENK